MADKKKSEFLKETISKDIREAEMSTLSKTLGVKESFTSEINPEQRMRKIKRKKISRMKILLTILGIVILVLLIGSVFVYFVYIAPFWITKPAVEKIELTDTLAEEHFNYIFNEIGAYKLHDAPLGGTPAQIELYIVNIMKRYTVTIPDRKATTFLGTAPDPDIRISINEKELIELYNAEDVAAKAKELVEANSIAIERIKDEAVLASKGYKAVYDKISGEKIRGSSLLKISSGIKRILYLIAVLIVCGIGSWYLIKTRKLT